VLISDPSWENHRALFTNAGFTVETYPYYDAATRGVRFDAMLAALRRRPRHRGRAARLLPQPDRLRHHARAVGTGVPPPASKRAAWCPSWTWPTRASAEGIAEDGAASCQFLASGMNFFVSTSFSKSFSLYGERVGALSVVCGSKDEAARVLSQLKIVIRTNYSNPPTFGAQVVATVLTTPACARCGKKNWPACANASSACATAWWPSCRLRA
jgi:aromatic-amino-acid transaminase